MAKLTGTLGLKRFDKDYHLLESRVQPMRSWTRGMMELLYLWHANIQYGTGYLGNGDIDGIARLWSVGGIQQFNRWYDPQGMVAAHGGKSCFHTPIGNWNTNAAIWFGVLQGHQIGIQAGNDNTAVTPADYKLGRRIGNGVRPADGADATIESFDTGDTSQQIVHGNNWVGQPFVPISDFRCSEVEVKVFKTGAPPADLEVLICQMDSIDYSSHIYALSATPLASGNIAAAAVGATPGAFVAATMTVPVTLIAGVTYCIVLKMVGGDAGNSYSWRLNAASSFMRAISWASHNVFTYRTTSANAGATWAVGANGTTHMFRARGRSIGDFEHGGTDVHGLTIADPNASFEIRKFFTNNSGASIDVQEVGLNTFMKSQATAGGGAGRIIPIQIARDVVAPAVAVDDTEILLVTYTPSITV
jgi:hypothetical protein